MTDLESRAAAIGELLTNHLSSSPPPEVTEAAAACCRDLVDAGEPRIALDLLTQLAAKQDLTAEQQVTISFLQVLALRASGEHRAAYERARRCVGEYFAQIGGSFEAAILLRIHMAGCLWQMNRADE